MRAENEEQTMILNRFPGVLAVVFVASAAIACGDDDKPAAADTADTSPDTSSPDTVVAETPCSRAGGAATVASLIYDKANPANNDTLVGRFAGDCRINAFFDVPKAALDHVGECLTIQVQELFGCPGVTYSGSKSSGGQVCRDMKTAHTGLAISQGDFDALIQDTAAFVQPLVAAGVLTEAEFTAAAGVLVGLGPDIVEDPATSPTLAMCQ
jgi:hypothetical protein